uniref:Uncharacterized protein n=1 Tax=Sphaerodactylus townsendi TaxID=933632 RepID=A0ACB8F2Y1_9SAUR
MGVQKKPHVIQFFQLCQRLTQQAIRNQKRLYQLLYKDPEMHLEKANDAAWKRDSRIPDVWESGIKKVHSVEFKPTCHSMLNPDCNLFQMKAAAGHKDGYNIVTMFKAVMQNHPDRCPVSKVSHEAQTAESKAIHRALWLAESHSRSCAFVRSMCKDGYGTIMTCWINVPSLESEKEAKRCAPHVKSMKVTHQRNSGFSSFELINDKIWSMDRVQILRIESTCRKVYLLKWKSEPQIQHGK